MRAMQASARGEGAAGGMPEAEAWRRHIDTGDAEMANAGRRPASVRRPQAGSAMASRGGGPGAGSAGRSANGSASRKRHGARGNATVLGALVRWAILVLVVGAAAVRLLQRAPAGAEETAAPRPSGAPADALAEALSGNTAGTDADLAALSRETAALARKLARDSATLAAAASTVAGDHRPAAALPALPARQWWTTTTATTRAPVPRASQATTRRFETAEKPAWKNDPRGTEPNDPTAETRRKAVREAMVHAYHGYEQFAWGFDELQPLSKKGKNLFGGTGATIVDSLDTLWLMGLEDEFARARDWVAEHLEFDYPKDTSVFETTIRVLGGLLSAYDLSAEPAFLSKAHALAEKMRPAFETATGIPRNNINFHTGKVRSAPWAKGMSILAEYGTEQLEWIALSYRTGDPSYASLVRRSMSAVVDRAVQNSIGLVPIYIDPDSGKFGQAHVTFGAMGDSFYEYLLKMYVQSNRGPRDQKFYDYWLVTMDQMIDRLATKTSPSELLYIDEWKGNRKLKKMDHLVCFVPGMLALGLINAPEGMGDPIEGRREKYLNAAEGIAEFCYRMYENQPTGLAPEFVKIVDGHDMQPGAPHNLLRPETVESLMLLWRLTKKEKYRDWGWSIFQAFERHCRSEVGYAGVKDVRKVPAQKDDTQQSFFLAETLKYLYLLFSPDDVVPLDEWVFNTEAHPLHIHRA